MPTPPAAAGCPPPRAPDRALPRAALALGGAALLGLLATSVVHVPAGSVAILSWRGGGTPALLPPGFSFRLPFLQRVERFRGGVVAAEGQAEAASREGSGVAIPFRVEIRPRDQDLLALHQEGKGGGARAALAAIVAAQIKRVAASAGTYDLASGVFQETLVRQVQKGLDERFTAGSRLTLSAPKVPPEVRASFERVAIYGRRQETGVQIVLVGIDAGDWDVIDPMIARGELPNLARLKRRGAWSRMRSNIPTLSPLLWTTMATGKAPDRHGINDFLVVDPASGRRVPINSTFRKAKALWNVLSEAGLQNDVIAWWATWPAETIAGHLISDRVAYTTWDIARPEDTRGMVTPPGYAAVVKRLRVSEQDVPFREIAGFIHVGEAEFEKARTAVRGARQTEEQESINVLVRVLASTETYRRIALDLLESRSRASSPARFFAVYFQGVDEVNHRFAHCAAPRMPLCPDADYRRFKDVVPAFYRYQDRILGEILERAPGATVIVLSDHGFATGESRPPDVKPFITGKPGLWHDLAGIFMVAGPPVKPGELPIVTLYDVAPTVLYLLGLPVPEDMPGKVLDGAMTDEFTAAHPVVKVHSYEELTPKAQGPSVAGMPEGGADQEMVEQLRSLGYVGAAAPPAATPAGSPVPASPSSYAPGGAGIPTLLYHTNLGAVYLGKKLFDKAEAEYRKALQIDPASTQALTGLAALHEAKGEPEQALAILEGVERQGPASESVPLAKMADLFIRLGRATDGVAFMHGLEARRADGGSQEIGLRVALGMLDSASGRPADAEKELLRALGLDPASVIVMQELFPLYDGQGRARELEPRIHTALDRAPRSAMHHNWLGLVLKRRGDLKGAEGEFRRTLELAPSLAGAMANLGSLFIQEGKPSEAVTLLRGTLEKDPQSVESRTNLIVALGMTGDLTGARREVEKAEAGGSKVALYYNALAYALYVNGRSDEALETVRESLKLDPKQADALRLRGEIERGQMALASPYR